MDEKAEMGMGGGGADNHEKAFTIRKKYIYLLLISKEIS